MAMYTDTNTGGALSMSTKGTLFIVERGVNPTVTELSPVRQVRRQAPGRADGLHRRVINDLAADSEDALHSANPRGQVAKYGDGLRTNGIILSTDEKTLYVTNPTTVVAFDVQPDGSLTSQRDFGRLEGGGFGDGSAIDVAGRIYVTTDPGVQVLAPDGRYLGFVPNSMPCHQCRLLGNRQEDALHFGSRRKGPTRRRSRECSQVYSISMVAQGLKNRAK